jgi:hypothetical protein
VGNPLAFAGGGEVPAATAANTASVATIIAVLIEVIVASLGEEGTVRAPDEGGMTRG